MKTIRTSVFETNSSSSHSISISNSPSQAIPNFRGQNFELTGGEFGWGPDSYYNWETKANYAAVAIVKNELKLHKEWLVEILKEKLGCEEVIFKIDPDSYSSYIDHQSSSVFQYSVESKDDLYKFVFCDSELVIDNDNRDY